MELLHPGRRDVVDAPAGTGLGEIPGRVHQPFVLERTQHSVDAAAVALDETERSQPLEEVIAVGRLLAEQQESAGPQKVARKLVACLHCPRQPQAAPLRHVGHLSARHGQLLSARKVGPRQRWHGLSAGNRTVCPGRGGEDRVSRDCGRSRRYPAAAAGCPCRCSASFRPLGHAVHTLVTSRLAPTPILQA